MTMKRVCGMKSPAGDDVTAYAEKIEAADGVLYTLEFGCASRADMSLAGVVWSRRVCREQFDSFDELRETLIAEGADTTEVPETFEECL